jgi:hypothetical protein
VAGLHARACAAVKMALRHNFRVIYHCDFADEECLDQLEAKKNEVFVAPAIGIVYTTAYEASAWGITKCLNLNRIGCNLRCKIAL